jgi:hypothetical protein
MVLVVIAGLMVFAATHAPRLAAKTGTETTESCSNDNKAQGDFNIWEAVGHTLLSNVQY